MKLELVSLSTPSSRTQLLCKCYKNSQPAPGNSAARGWARQRSCYTNGFTRKQRRTYMFRTDSTLSYFIHIPTHARCLASPSPVSRIAASTLSVTRVDIPWNRRSLRKTTHHSAHLPPRGRSTQQQGEAAAPLPVISRQPSCLGAKRLLTSGFPWLTLGGRPDQPRYTNSSGVPPRCY